MPSSLISSFPPVPPPLPPGSTVNLPERGELFVRSCDGPDGSATVVLLHGWMASADLNFFPLFEPLGRSHGILAPDLRGHARSLLDEHGFSLEDAADDIAALLHSRDSGPAIVVGYSLGTSVAQVLADRHPDAVRSLVLVAGECRPRRQLHKKVLLRAAGWQGSWQRLTNGRWLGHRVVDKAATTNPAVEQIRPWLVAELERGHPAMLRSAGRALGRFDARDIAARRSTPTVVVRTTRDRVVLPHLQTELAAAWDAPIVDLEADHDAPVADPIGFVDAVIEAVALADGRWSSGTPGMAVRAIG